MMETNILAADEASPVMLHRAQGASPFLINCDHAGKEIPRALGTLGLPDSEIARHIGWDIGAWAVSLLLSDALDAPLIGQRYSRLVIDCNRAPGVPSSIPALSEETEIPGNIAIAEAQRDARAREILRPYQDAIGATLDGRGSQPTVLVAMHSFTPVFKGYARPWHVGVLFNRDPRLARLLLELLRAEGDLVVGENEPYSVSDLTDYTVPVHGEKRGLPHLELEIRQDLIADAGGQQIWAEKMIRLLPEAYARFLNAGYS